MKKKQILNPYLETSFHVDFRNGTKLNFYAEIMEKFVVEVDVKIQYLYEKT